MSITKNSILIAGSINMDLVIDTERLPIKGETLIGKTIRYIPGGKGANQAVSAARLGANVLFIGKVGQDSFGPKLKNFLKKEKLDLRGLEKSSLSSGLAFITVDSNGDNTIVILPGSNSEVDPIYIEKNRHLIQEANMIVAQYEIPLESVDRLFTIAKNLNKITLLNPAPALKTPNEILKKVDYLVLNETELSFFVDSNKTLEELDEIISAARMLQKRGTNIVVVTLGSRGAITITQDNVIRTEGIKVNAVDTTAAGDCFIGALAVQLNNDASLEAALDFANRVAAISVQRFGGSRSLPTLREVMK